jgi:hypothetical protein
MKRFLADLLHNVAHWIDPNLKLRVAVNEVKRRGKGK